MNQTVKLSGITLILLSLLLTGCTAKPTLPTAAELMNKDTQEPCSSALLQETEDMGQSYLDSFVFLGESTTYHLKSRGVLKGGKQTTQVWGPDGGTVNLDTSIGSLRIRYPETGELLPLSEALARKRPKRLLLCFGLNGAPTKLKRGKESFKTCYRVLLDTVKSASPDTTIILQSAFPVAENMDMSAYSLTLDQLNDAIETINGWTLELAEEEGVYYLNTAEILQDEEGRLPLSYQVGDGHHLNREAYVRILSYIRTHGCE